MSCTRDRLACELSASVQCTVRSEEPADHRADVGEITADKQVAEHVRVLFPWAASIIAAFPGVNIRGHPGQIVLETGHEMAAQHQRQWDAEDISRAPGSSTETIAACKRLIDDLNSRRVMLVERIDDWVAREIRCQADASLHTETLGSVVDRLAIAWVRTNSLVSAVDARDRARLALRQLAELAGAYDDLVRDVALGRRRLPTWRSLKNYRSTP